MGIHSFTDVIRSLVEDHKGATAGQYLSLASSYYGGRSTSECHIVDVLIMMYRLTFIVPKRPGATKGCLTCDEIFNELFIRTIRHTNHPGLESYRVVFIADKQRHKRDNLHLKRDEAARRTADRLRAVERSGKAPPKVYPSTSEFGDLGVKEQPGGAWEPVDISRFLVSLGRPASDAFWKYMQDRLNLAATADSRDEMFSKLYRTPISVDGYPRLMHCRIEADLVESETDTFGEADIGIIQRAVGELKKPTHESVRRQTTVIIHSDDTDAVAHAIYVAWSLGLPRPRLFVERSRTTKVKDVKDRYYVYDIVGLVALLVKRGWSRDHFLAACIIGGCDFFKSSDGVTIRNVGAIPLWMAQSRVVYRLRHAAFPTPAAVLAMYVLVVASHCGVDLVESIPTTGGLNADTLGLLSPESIEVMFTTGASVRGQRGTRVLRPLPPLKSFDEVCTRFGEVWSYWTTSFDVSQIPVHGSDDERVDVVMDF